MRTRGHLSFLITASLAVIGGIAVCGCDTPKTPPPAVDAPQIHPDSAKLNTLVELARRDVQLEKAVLISKSLPLTEAEAAEFWPIHRQYEQDLAALMDRKLTLIRGYFSNQGNMTDAQAKTLAQETLDLESKRTDLKRSYFRKFQAAVPAAKAARFFQIENQLNMLIELQIASELPLIK